MGTVKVIESACGTSREIHFENVEDFLRFERHEDGSIATQSQDVARVVHVEENPWIEWDGDTDGKCPVPDDYRVEVRFRNGEACVHPYTADSWHWGNHGESYDIVAYRVIGSDEPEAQAITE